MDVYIRSSTLLACSQLLSLSAMDVQEEFLRESELMLQFNHVNLVRLIGVAVQQRPWLCVLEYMEVRLVCARQVVGVC